MCVAAVTFDFVGRSKCNMTTWKVLKTLCMRMFFHSLIAGLYDGQRSSACSFGWWLMTGADLF
jgi:hypothetical protein